MERDLTQGNITKNLLKFTIPLIAGNIFQQFYNIADTWIVGKFIGAEALAAVGSSYTLMVFITSIFIGLCMGSSGLYSIYFGRKDFENLKKSFGISFVFIGILTLILNAASVFSLDWIMKVLEVPREVMPLMGDYLEIIFLGITAVFLYNYFAYLLRSIGNSVTPLVFLGVSAVLNVILDLFFVISIDMGVKGAALATVISQFISAFGIAVYTWVKFPHLRISKRHLSFETKMFKKLANMSVVTCLQQSVMNFGILMVQGLVNSFGTVIMAAFAAAVKIDSLAYMPVQDFGNGFSTFVAQNYGAGKKDRIIKGIKSSLAMVTIFCITVSLIVFILAEPLMSIFIDSSEVAIIKAGAEYLRIEGACYIGIGILFMLYGFYRAVVIPSMSLVLTIISLGTRVILAYTLSQIPQIGVYGIWVSVPIGWLLADIAGMLYYKWRKRYIWEECR